MINTKFKILITSKREEGARNQKGYMGDVNTHKNMHMHTPQKKKKSPKKIINPLYYFATSLQKLN